MAIVTTRQKQQIFFALIPVVLLLCVISIAIQYWYVTVPLLVVLIVLIVVLARRRQRAAPQPSARPLSPLSVGDIPENRRDFAEAALLVVSTQFASESMLQRKMRIGFVAAGRLMEELERQEIVGPKEGTKSRQVLISPEHIPVMLEAIKSSR